MMINRVRQMRLDMGDISQTEFGKLLGFTHTKIGKIENPNSTQWQPLTETDIETACKNNKSLRPWQFFHAPEDIKKEVLEDDEYLLLMNFHKMPESLRGKLIGAVETVMSNNGIQPYTSVDQIKDEKNERT